MQFDYNISSEKLCAIKALGVQQTRWNNYSHDLHGNHQKLYCHLITGEDVILKCEYTSSSALIAVHHSQRFKGIGELAPELVEPVLNAIRTVYPDAEVVGEQKFIRVIFTTEEGA